MPEIITVELQVKLGSPGQKGIQGAIADFLQSINETVCDAETHTDATGVTDQAVSFGPVTTAEIFYLASDQQVTYKLNSSATTHTLKANGFHLLYGDSVTSMTVTNTSGSTATLTKLVAGT